jgi:hypothetical protein
MSLKDSAAASARAAGDAIRPVVESAMGQVAQQADRVHARLGEVAQGQVEMAAARFDATAQAMASTFHDALRATADELQGAWRLAGEQGLAQQAAITTALEQAAANFEEPLTRLLRTASEVPQSAAGVVAQLREEMSRLTERDNLALQERTLLLEQLRGLLDAVHAATDRQRVATDALLASATSAMEEAGSRLAASLDAQSARAGVAATHMVAGAVELSAVADAFVQGVQQFQAGSDKLVEGLDRMEASLRRATTRSDEQLAYYVAQAREVIDLSIASQQGLVENLRALQVRPIKTLPPEGARA